MAAVDYYDAEAVETYDGRNWFQDWGTVTNPQWPGTGPQLLTRPHVTSTLYTFGGMIQQPGSSLHRLVFQRDGTTSPFVLGDPYALAGTQSQSGGVGDNFERDRAADGGLVPNVSRDSAFGHFTFAVSDSVQLYAEAIHGSNEVDGNGFASVMHGPWQARIFRENPYLPPGVRRIMEDEGLTAFGFSRMGSTADLSVSRLVQANALESYTVGVESRVGDWRLEAYYQTGRDENRLDAVHFPRTDRLFLAMDAVVDPASGQAVCNRTLFDPSFRCVPIDLLGAARAAPEAIAYVTDGVKTATAVTRQRVIEVSVDGDLIDGWGAGPVSFAVGIDYREETLAQTVQDPTNPTNDRSYVAVPFNDPSQGIRGIPVGFAGVSSGVQFSIVPDLSGSVGVKELFSELLVPLTADHAWARRLNMSAAARWADYSGSGGITSWKLGLDWQAVDALRVRATASRDVRAANMSERFDSAGAGATVMDPVFGNQNVTFTQIIAGNPSVEPERADTRTFGVVVQPPGIAGLSLSLDRYSIDVAGSIGQLGPQRIVNDCYAGVETSCAQITRDPITNVITGLRNLYLNINAAAVRGTDFEVLYSRSLRADSSLTFRAIGSRLAENSVTNLGGTKQDRAGETGALSLPETQVVSSLTYVRGAFTGFLQGRYISSGLRRYNGNRPEIGGVTIDDNTVDSVIYTDFSGSYRLPIRGGDLEIFCNVGNLFDVEPPLAANHTPFGGSTHTNATLFDTLGRRVVIGARFSF
jgi:outer membrane receptor protein involved in Fe transport